MSEQDNRDKPDLAKVERKHLEDKLSAVGWALFLIWVGVAYLLDIGTGLGVLGIGAITLGVQTARFMRGLGLETFWVIVGLLFLLGGIWVVLGIEPKFPLVPSAFIVFGLAVLWSVMKRNPPQDGR